MRSDFAAWVESKYPLVMGDCKLGRKFLSVDQARDNLLSVCDLLEGLNFEHFVIAGALWTILRDGDIHPGDYDVDFMIPQEYAESFVDSVLPKILELGFSVVRVDKILLLSFGRGGETLDVYWGHRDERGWIIGGSDHRFPHVCFDSHTTIPYRGRSLRAPNKADAYLSEHARAIHGKDWRINYYDFPGEVELSILIPTIYGRESYLDKLLPFLQTQCKAVGGVEILLWKDKVGEHTTGCKRNLLMDEASGRFCAFVDDDDWVAPDYVSRIVDSIERTPDLDVIGFWGEVSFACGARRVMLHSLLCPTWMEDIEVYYRPPNHLNPVRTAKAKQIRFQDVSTSEDHFWSMELAGKKLLKHEVFLGGEPLYYYRCREKLKGL